MEARAAQTTEVQSWIWKMMEEDESFDVISVSTYSYTYAYKGDRFAATTVDLPVTTVTFRCATYRGSDPLFRKGNIWPLEMGSTAAGAAEPPAYGDDVEEAATELAKGDEEE